METGRSREGSVDGSQGDDLLPEKLSEEFIEELNSKVDLYIDRQEKCGDQESANLVRQLQKVFFKFKSDLTASEAKILKVLEESEIGQARINEALQISKSDQGTIKRLQTSIENAWKQTDAAQARELTVQEELQKVKEKLESYEENAKKAESKKDGRLSSAEVGKDMGPLKESILKERDKLNSEVKELNRRIQIQRIYTTEIENLCSNLEEKNKTLFKFLETASMDVLKEKKQVENIAKELVEAKEVQMSMENVRKKLKEQNENYIKNNVQLSIQVLAAKSRSANFKSKFAAASNKLIKASGDLENLIDSKNRIQTELNQKAHLLKLKEEETVKLKSEYNNLSKANDMLVKKLMMAQQTKTKVDGEDLRLKNQCNILEKEITTAKKSIDDYSKRVSDLIKERDSTKKDLLQAKKQIELVREKLSVSMKEIESLKDEAEKCISNEKFQKQQVTKVKKEALQLAEEIQALEDKIELQQNDIQLKNDYIIELRKAVTEANTKFVNLQSLFENIRSERNLLHKNLLAITKEKGDTKQQLEKYMQDVETLKEKLASKEAEVSKLELQCDKGEKEKSRLKVEVENCQVILQNTRSELQEKKGETDNLYKSLMEDESKFKKIKKELEEVKRSKAQLSSQLSARSDEIAVLIERLNVTQEKVDRGNQQYSQRLEDIRLLKIEIQNLRSEQEILRKDRENAAKSRRELLRLHRLLNQERVKARALQEEMLTPMNVHRWRALAGKDPEKAELISKVNGLQKKMLISNVTAIERENSLQQANMVYLSLKEFMLKLPSYKVKEQLNEIKHALDTKEKKMKALVAEINAKEVDEKTRECIMEDLRSNLETTKRELTRERKKKQKLLEERHILAHMQMQCFSASAACLKTAGAGFKMPLTG